MLDLKHISKKYNYIFGGCFIGKTEDHNTNVVSSLDAVELSAKSICLTEHDRSFEAPYIYSICSFGKYLYISYYNQEISKGIYAGLYYKRIPISNFYVEKYDDSCILVFTYDKILSRREFAKMRHRELDLLDFSYRIFRKYWNGVSSVRDLLSQADIIDDINSVVELANKNKNKNAPIELDKPTDINGWKILYNVIRLTSLRIYGEGPSKLAKKKYLFDS